MMLRRYHEKKLKEEAKKQEDVSEASEVEEIEAEQMPDPQESAEEGTEDLDELTVPEIKKRLDAAGIEYKSSENRPELFEKLKGE